jgi:hypothetical protein
VADYQVGDILVLDLNDKGLKHIGIVVELQGKPGKRLIVHNSGQGPKMQNCLLSWTIIGHYRYHPSK